MKGALLALCLLPGWELHQALLESWGGVQGSFWGNSLASILASQAGGFPKHCKNVSFLFYGQCSLCDPKSEEKFCFIVSYTWLRMSLEIQSVIYCKMLWCLERGPKCYWYYLYLVVISLLCWNSLLFPCIWLPQSILEVGESSCIYWFLVMHHNVSLWPSWKGYVSRWLHFSIS